MFVDSGYAPTDCSADAIKDIFYQQLDDFLNKPRAGDIVTSTRDINATADRLFSNKVHLGGLFGLDCVVLKKGEGFLALYSNR